MTMDNNDNTESFTVLIPGTVVSQYKIISKLGAGGMGEVYLAEDTKLDRKVALKFLPPHLCRDEECRARFMREAKAAAKLDHPNIVPVHEVGEFQGRPFFAMAHIEGKSLREVIKEGKLTVTDAVGLTMQICEGLNKAHESGVVHRDIKPANILIDKENRPRILDFGLATVSGEMKLTKTGSTLGTVGYMSPEQVKGERTDHRSDLFSVGVVLYEMIAGRMPFEGEHEAAIHYNIVNEQPEPLSRYKSGVTGELQQIVDKALSKDPSLRYQHADGMLSDLKRVVASIPSRDLAQASRIKIGGKIAIIAVMIVAAIFGGLQLRHWLAPSEVEAKSLAIVDFDNIGSEEDAYLASGLAEDLAVKLRNISGFQVASCADIRRLSKQDLLAKDVASQLGVQYALGGSLLRHGEKIQINVELIEEKSGKVIWSEQFSRQFTEVFQFIDEVSRGISEALEVHLVPAEQLALKKKPTENSAAYNHYLKGRHYYCGVTFRDNELAEKEFQRALQLDADYPLALAGLADVYVQRYKERFDYDEYWLDSSDVLIDRALELNPNLAEAYEARAEVLLEKDNLLGALEAAQKARDLQPDWDEPYVRLGKIYEQRGELSKALELFEQAIAIRPSVGALCGKGSIFRTRLKFDSAEAAYRAAIELNPEHDQPYLGLGFAYWEDPEESPAKAEDVEQMFRRAIEVRPDRADSYEWLIWLKGAEVEDLLRNYVEKYPYNWEAYDALFQLLAWMTGDWPGALEVMKQAIDKNPDRVWPYLMSAWCRTLGMGKTVEPDKSVKEIERALELRPNSSRVLEAAGSIYSSLDKPEKAFEYYRKALKVNPGSAGILSSMAELLLHYHKYDSAVIVALEAIEQKPGVTRFLSWRNTWHNSYEILRDAMVHLYRSDEYLDIIKNATEKYGQDEPEFFLYLADEQRLSGRFEEAVTTYQRYPDIEKNHYPLLRLGMAQWLSGDPENALKTFYNAAANTQWSRRTVSLLKYMGKFDEIEQYLDTLNIEGLGSWLQPAPYYYRSMRRFDDALAVYEEILKSKEKRLWEDWDMLEMAKLYRQMGKLAKAREILKYDESWPASVIVGVTIELAILSAIEGDIATAMNLAREAFENSPADNFYDSRVGFCATMQYATGQTEEALNTLKKVKGLMLRALFPALYLRAQLETLSGSQEAEYYVEKVQLLAARGTRQAHPYNDLAMFRCFCALASARLGDLKRARDEIEYARRLEPERADIAYYSACTYSLMGDTALALQWLQTAVDRGQLDLWWARVDPDLDPLRELPRFKEIMNDWDSRIQGLLAKNGEDI